MADEEAYKDILFSLSKVRLISYNCLAKGSFLNIIQH